MSFLDKLGRDGYVIFRNNLTNNELNEGLKSIHNQKIDYTQMKKFIDTIYWPKVNKALGWNSIYLKFRFSNFENLKDASLFHGDVYNHTESKTMPIYTGLCYFDDSLLEIIPGSHIKNNLSSCDLFNNKKIINIKKGDMLIFHANMYHRGIAFDPKHKQKNRRLLQIFEIWPNKEQYNEMKNNFLTVLTNKTDLIKKFYNIGPFAKKFNVNEYIVYLHYLLVRNDMQYKIIFSDISNETKNGKYVGYEPGIRDIIRPNQLQPWNVNIIVNKHNTIIPNTTTQTIVICILFIILIHLLIKLIKKIISIN